MEERYKSKIVVDLLLERQNPETNKKEILLSLRQNTGYADGLYDLPGGHLDPNEDIFDAMIREAKEEIGIDIERNDLKIVHINHRFKKGMLKFVFKVDKYKNDVTNGEPDKCKELRWVEIDNLPENIIEHIKKEIILTYDGIDYSKD